MDLHEGMQSEWAQAGGQTPSALIRFFIYTEQLIDGFVVLFGVQTWAFVLLFLGFTLLAFAGFQFLLAFNRYKKFREYSDILLTNRRKRARQERMTRRQSHNPRGGSPITTRSRRSASISRR